MAQSWSKDFFVLRDGTHRNSIGMKKVKRAVILATQEALSV